jgi:hypothetical protein
MGVGGRRHAPATLRPGKEIRYPLYWRLGGAPGPVWRCLKNLTHSRNRSLDRSARNGSLYRLSYSGPHYFILRVFVYSCWVLIGSVLCACTLINSIELLPSLLLFKPLLIWEQRHSYLSNYNQHSPTEANNRLASQ